VRAGFLESLKGKGGGFYFDQDKPDLPLKKLISSIEGDSSFTGCGFGLKQCSEKNPCPVHEKYAPIREAINRLVSEETVQSLAMKAYKKKINPVTERNEKSEFKATVCSLHYYIFFTGNSPVKG